MDERLIDLKYFPNAPDVDGIRNKKVKKLLAMHNDLSHYHEVMVYHAMHSILFMLLNQAFH